MSRAGAIAVFVAATVVLTGSPAREARADMIDTSSMAAWEHCALCHSADGISRTARFPKLAGQKAAYIEKQVRDFKSGRRSNDGGPMQTNTEELTEADIKSVSVYFAKLSPPPPVAPDEVDADLEMGRALFEGGKPETGVAACASCHVGPGQAGILAPHITAQHAGYLQKQLAEFRDGSRDNDTDGQMRRVAATLNDAEIAAVSAYAATLERKIGAAP